jgi:DNA polymerase (family 10)
MTRVIADAAREGVAMEINAQLDRRDLDDTHARSARDAGVHLVISSDSHSPTGFSALRWGVATARRAWLTADDILNTKPVDALRSALRRHRQ